MIQECSPYSMINAPYPYSAINGVYIGCDYEMQKKNKENTVNWVIEKRLLWKIWNVEDIWQNENGQIEK